MRPPCYLEWREWSKDRVMGLNHQMSALSCALGEAFFLNRTLLLPDRVCLDLRHEQRWGRAKQAEASCSAHGVRGASTPIADLLDLDALSQLVDVLPVELPRRPGSRGGGPLERLPKERVVQVDRTWKSARIGAAHPCGLGAALVQRRVSSFWFRPCAYGISDGHALLSRVHRLVRAHGVPDAGGHVTHLLRSGLFYSQAVKRAARAVRLRLGPGYYAVHLRRSDKFSSSCDRATFTPAQCKKMELMTRPAELGRALALWLPSHSTLYVGSTEAPAFLAPLRAAFRLFVPDDLAPLLGDISNNYMLYAVESLVFFGAAAAVETFEYALGWLQHACFPAAGAPQAGRAAAEGRMSSTVAERRRGARGKRIGVECADASGVLAAGVYYGHACTDNPPCGVKNAFVLDGQREPHGCGPPLQPSRGSPARQSTCFER